ncbi:MAG: hypothetical protein KDA75_05810 [Planctomycetaceae bacterium]|nr:hypothetical protein [Planctomycetaceae bacterium]
MTCALTAYRRSLRRCVLPALLPWLASIASAVGGEAFGVRIVDSQTSRGVPLVTLRTTNEQTFVTDSAGYAAIDAPDLLGRKVFLHIESHGYEFPKDGFGFRGRTFDLAPSGGETVELERLNVAERLYRVTGGGIYAESIRLGHAAPLSEAVLSGGVTGQDSVQSAVFRGQIHWFWGDTNRLSYPLGQFRTSGATSQLPDNGGLAPEIGIDLTYFVDEQGFSRPMFAKEGPGVVWLDGLCVVSDDDGQEHLVGHYSRREGLARQLAHGIAEFDPDAGAFRTLVELPEASHTHPQGQAFHVTDERGEDFVYFASPYPSRRVPATLAAILDPAAYESYTPLPVELGKANGEPNVERRLGERQPYSWSRHAPPVSAEEEYRLIEQGELATVNSHWQTQDATTGERVILHGGSVRWNEYRQRWVMIAVQKHGNSSFLGEVWYAESDRPEGPWTRAMKIVTHDRYSFYNPTQHAFFDQDGGRLIYFEGTYTHTFSGNPNPTPRYDYNQIMYRLDLSDPQLDVVRTTDAAIR